MSRMLQALQNLSDRPAEFTPTDEPARAEPAEESPVNAADCTPTAVDHGRRMKELLVKHLVAPTPSQMLRNLKAELQRPSDFHVPGNMTVPIGPTAQPLTPAALLDLDDSEEPEESVRESISLTFPMSAVATAEEPASPVGLASVDRMENLLQSLAEEEDTSGEQIAVSFGSDEPPGEPGPEVNWQESSESERPREAIGSAAAATPVSEPMPEVVAKSEPAVSPPSPEAPPPAVAVPVAASPLDHLTDVRPLVEYEPDDEPAAPPPLTLPPRTISRCRTRLEQRVNEGLANPSRSAAYRELADRLAQDLRLLTGRCLLFSGIGPASRGDDLLAHLGALLAEVDAEVLLVDADFTRAGLSVGLGALKETGLGELLEQAGRGEELILPTLLPNVSLLPAGRKALPDSLGVVDHLAQLLAKLERRFALILIDGGTHTQALAPSLARLCDATYFVVRLGATDARTAATALKAFRGCGARVMGCVATTAS